MFYKRRYRRRRYKRRYTKYSKLKKDVRKLKSIVNVEYKNTIGEIDQTPGSGGWSGLTLLSIAQGDDSDDRTGRSIKLVSVEIRGTVTLDASATQTYVRMALGIDKQPNGALITDSVIWNDTASGSNLNAMRDSDSAKRFIVLHDRTIQVNTDNPQYHFHIFKKLYCHVKFQGTTASVASIATNNLCWFTTSNEATNTPAVKAGIKINFIDN